MTEPFDPFQRHARCLETSPAAAAWRAAYDRRRALRTLAALPVSALSLACNRATTEHDERSVVFRHPKLFGDPKPLDRLLEHFTQAHGIRVHRSALPASSDEQHLYYAINFAAGTPEFDVLALDTIWVAEFAAAGWLRDLSHLLSPGDEMALFPAPLASATWQGHRYALPWFVDVGLLYYRTDLLAQHHAAPPRTWTELVELSHAAQTRAPDLFGFVWQGKQYEGLVCTALEFVWSHGGDLYASKAGAARGLQFMRGLVSDGVSPSFVTTLTEEPARVLFAHGRAMFLRNWPYAWHLLQRTGSRVAGRVGVCALPAAAGAHPAGTLGGWHLGVNANSPRAAYAERLVAFLSAAPAQKALALAYGYSPPRRTLYGDRELVATQPFLATLLPLLETARPRPVVPYYVALSQMLQSEFSGVLTGVREPRAALAEIDRARRRLEA